MKNQIFNELSIRTRLITMLIAVTLFSVLILGLVSWHNGRTALNKTIFNQLNGIRSAQASQVEFYFRQTFAHTRSLASDRMIVNAMNQFQEGYNNGLYQSLDEEQDQAVSTFYEDEFVPAIAANTTNTPLSILYQPSRAAARYFQYHYIVNNPYPVGDKDGLVESKNDTTIYNRFHKFYHPIFRGLQNEFNYYDIFLVDLKSLSVVYSVFKEVDFATSLQDGPFRETSLGQLANQIKANPERDLVSIQDYRSYSPSFGAPGSFIGAPIFDRNEAIGILIVQLPTDELDSVMTASGRWKENGLGESGESYLVGSDKLMRSTSRLFKEDRVAFIENIKNHGISDSTIDDIEKFNTTVLLQPVANDSVSKVFNDETGTHVTTNYMGKKVLSTYSPVKIPGLDWAIISEMGEEEAFKEIRGLQRNILICGVALVLLIAFASIFLSRIFVRPIEKLYAGVDALRSGDAEARIDINNNDEFGSLALHFNNMAEDLHDQTLVINEKSDENDELLGNALPAHLVDRFRKNLETAEQHQQATTMQLELDGFSEVSNLFNTQGAAIKLQSIIDQLDSASERYDVLPVSSAGTAYIAVCGLKNARLDHAKCTVDLSLAAIKIILQFNEINNTNISVRIGIDSGVVNSAIIGSHRFKFGLWGDTVDTARMARNLASPNSILVTEDVFNRVNNLYDFRKYGDIKFGSTQISTHELIVEKQSSESKTTLEETSA